ncbi:Glutathione gamma-glutamylcysteinyltransferase 1-like protein [Drosera capensis]
MAAVADIYRRVLPSPPAIEFASPGGKLLFKEALEKGHMDGFFKLVSYYQTQSEPAYCGLASLSVVLNALAIDPGRKWKGPWRWFDDSMLDCCEPIEKIKVNGISFNKLVCLAHCNGAQVEAFHANESTIDNFRDSVVSCATSEDHHLIVSYHRAHLKQTGSGHFSPIGGYHAGQDLVLIMDVARFKYPPHWVPLNVLWEAMNTIDESTGYHRGFMIISKQVSSPSLLYTVSCHHASWKAAVLYLTQDAPHLFSTTEIKDLHELIAMIFTSAPTGLRDFIAWVVEVRRQEEDNKTVSNEERARLALKEELLKEVQETELYKHVTKWLAADPCCAPLARKDSLTEMSSRICCQGARLLSGSIGSSEKTCCQTSNVMVLKENGNKHIAMISGKVTTQSVEQGVDVLVPCQVKSDASCGCGSSSLDVGHPSTADVLTVLLLALPSGAWSTIQREELREAIQGLSSTDSLPPLLQDEVIHLRQQLTCLSTELRASPS